MEGKYGVDGYYWPKHKVLQKIAERRSNTSLWFRIKMWFGKVAERRVKQ